MRSVRSALGDTAAAPDLRSSRQCAPPLSTAAFDPGPVHRSAPRARAWASERTAPPPMKMGTPGTAARTEPADRATSSSRPLTVETMPTANNRPSWATASPRASAGAFPPSSTTSNPRQRRRSATIATGRMCRSPDGAARAIVPRSLPRRPNCSPRCPMTRCATAVARCSSRHRDLAAGPAFAYGAQGRNHHLGQHAGWIKTAAQVALQEPPRASAVAGQHPALQGLAVSAGPGRAPPSRRPERGDVGRVDPPLRAETGGGQPPLAHVAIRRHVVHAEAVCDLLERHRLGRVHGV